MTTADEFREYAHCCHMMGLGTNNPEWDSLAEQWLRRAAAAEGNAALAEPEKTEWWSDRHAA
jgi:hypothetical protein